MKRFLGVAFVVVLSAGFADAARADEKDAKAVIEKAIKALGGEDKLSKIKVFSAKGKGTISLSGNDIPFTFGTTARGIEQYRAEFEGEADGTKFEGVIVLDGDKGWRKIGEETTELKGDELAIEKRKAYLDVVPILIVPLKGKGFKVDSAAEEKVGGKFAALVKVTGPDGKDFTLYFDKESGLPIKLTGRVVDSPDEEFDQETTFEDYKDFGGIKVATKSKSKRDGEPFIDVEEMEFKVIDKVEPATFAEPK